MQHFDHLAAHGERLIGGKSLRARATGRFYTPDLLAEQLSRVSVDEYTTAISGSLLTTAASD